jgi:hypothetical protein
MNKDWLQKYPKAAALLQGDDDVLEYEPERAPLRIALQRHYRPHDTVRHSPRRAGSDGLLAWAWGPTTLAPTDLVRPCQTVLDARLYTASGQPCPCGQVVWWQPPSGNPALLEMLYRPHS